MDIKKFLELGGTISFPYKKSWKDWYSKVEFLRIGCHYLIYGEKIHKEFSTYEEASTYFVSEVLSRRNLGYVLHRLQAKGLYDPDEMEGQLDRNGYFVNMEFRDKINELKDQEEKLIRDEKIINLFCGSEE